MDREKNIKNEKVEMVFEIEEGLKNDIEEFLKPYGISIEQFIEDSITHVAECGLDEEFIKRAKDYIENEESKKSEGLK